MWELIAKEKKKSIKETKIKLKKIQPHSKLLPPPSSATLPACTYPGNDGRLEIYNPGFS